MTDNYKPCPFCGKTDASLVHISSEILDDGWVIECSKCRASGPEEYTEEEAWFTWNARAAVGVEEGKS